MMQIHGGIAMTEESADAGPPELDKPVFAALARRSGVPLTDSEVEILYEGYALLQRLVADMDRPADLTAEPATVFVPQALP